VRGDETSVAAGSSSSVDAEDSGGDEEMTMIKKDSPSVAQETWRTSLVVLIDAAGRGDAAQLVVGQWKLALIAEAPRWRLEVLPCRKAQQTQPSLTTRTWVVYILRTVEEPKSKRERGHEDKGRNRHGGETAMRSQNRSGNTPTPPRAPSGDRRGIWDPPRTCVRSPPYVRARLRA
jgi:hypothetical protein